MSIWLTKPRIGTWLLLVFCTSTKYTYAATVPVESSVATSSVYATANSSKDIELMTESYPLAHTLESQPSYIINSTAPKVNSEVQIGNSFFEPPAAKIAPIQQIGMAYESRFNMSDIFVFYNQLLSNSLFYELRAYGAYNYMANNRIFPRLSNSVQTDSPPGYGFASALGYNIPLNANVSLMPIVRIFYLNNFALVYQNSLGDSINSKTFGYGVGARLSMRINNATALYVAYGFGYSASYLSGSGRYSPSNGTPEVSGPTSSLEFGIPYRLSKRLSLTPSIQFNTTTNTPNKIADISPYNARDITVTNSLYGLRLSYDF